MLEDYRVIRPGLVLQATYMYPKRLDIPVLLHQATARSQQSSPLPRSEWIGSSLLAMVCGDGFIIVHFKSEFLRFL